MAQYYCSSMLAYYCVYSNDITMGVLLLLLLLFSLKLHCSVHSIALTNRFVHSISSYQIFEKVYFIDLIVSL